MKYTWDAGKNRRNVRLHGIDFADAIRIFEGFTLEQVDDRFDYDELRVYAIGVVNAVEIIYSDDERGERRIISAWRSEPHERRLYWKSLRRRTQ